MGKGAKAAFCGTKAFFKRCRKPIRRVLLSVISLVIVSVLLVTMSFSWFSIKTSELDAYDFELDCGKGLRVNDTGTSQLSFTEVDNYLTPASSVTGMNLYFPTDGSDFSQTTANMTFRSANVGDKNQNYIQIDFTLTAQQNHTALYINEEKTSIMVKSSNEQNYSTAQAGALRAALWSSTAEDGVPNTPIVFNPTSSTLYTAAVEDVDRSTGAFISSGRQVAHTFSEYSFGGTPVATLDRGIETKFSYIIWLEGTDPKCTDKIKDKDIQIKLAFTTSWDKTETIRFQDDTNGEWIKSMLNGNNATHTLTLHYEEVQTVNGTDQPTGSYMDFNMYPLNAQTDNVWSCNIPGDMRKNISFILRPKSGSNDQRIYKFTYSSKVAGETTLNRGSNRLYVAQDGQYIANNYETCKGYWVAIGDSDGAGHDNGGGLDGDDF